MRDPKHITIHCSAARPEAAAAQTVHDIHVMHRARGWDSCGYHFFVRTDGTVERGRNLQIMGAGVRGHNPDNIQVCYAGGLDENGKADDTRTSEQKAALADLVLSLCLVFGLKPAEDVKGHRDWYGDTNGDGVVDSRDWLKECPCFDVKPWVNDLALSLV